MNRLLRFSLIALAALIVMITGLLALPRGDRLLRNRALARREVALRVLAEYLADRLPGARTLVIGNPFARTQGQAADVYSFQETAMTGLKRGAGNRLVFTGIDVPDLSSAAARDPSLVPIPPDTTTPLSFLSAERSWDTLLARHPGTDLAVSLIGLPADVHQLEMWRSPKPQLALLLPDFRVVGDLDNVIAAFKSGKIVAAVLNHPAAPPESEPIARKHSQEFEKRFLLVTADNCEVVLRALLRAP